jgi:hypothetical protein
LKTLKNKNKYLLTYFFGCILCTEIVHKIVNGLQSQKSQDESVSN